MHSLLTCFFSSTFILWWISWPSYIGEHKYLYFSTLVVGQVCSFKESLCKNIYNSFFTQLFSPGWRVFIQMWAHTHTHTPLCNFTWVWMFYILKWIFSAFFSLLIFVCFFFSSFIVLTPILFSQESNPC